MKKLFLPISLAVTLFYVGCDKEELKIQKESAQQSVLINEIDEKFSPESFAQIGEMHNRGLDFIKLKYQELDKKAKPANEQEVAEFIVKQTKEFLSNESITVNGVEVTEFPLISAEELIVLDKKVRSSLSNRSSQEAFSRLMSIEINSTYQEVKTEVKNVREEFSVVSSMQEQNTQVQAYASVFDSSVDYWHEESDDIAELCWLCVANSDLAGAYSGASFGTTLGPGGTVGGAIGIGIMSSGYTAVLGAIWDKYSE